MLLMVAPTARANWLDPLDNPPLPEGTFLIAGYFGYNHHPEYKIKDGPTFDIDFDISYTCFRPVYYGPKIADKLSWGLQAVFPTFMHLSMDGTKTNTGLADLNFGGFIFLYENDNSGLYVSFWEMIQAPTGSFDQNYPDVSPSYDAWWFQNQMCLGYYPGKFSFDAGLSYWLRLESDEHSYDYPDALELELIAGYAVTEKFRVALQGTLWWDLQDASISRNDIPHTKGTNYKAGLNLGYHLSHNLAVNLRYMHDVVSENYIKGSDTYLRLTYIWWPSSGGH